MHSTAAIGEGRDEAPTTVAGAAGGDRLQLRIGADRSVAGPPLPLGMDLLLPFKIGGLAESKSFLTGYRSAWFRCKVLNMRVNKSARYLEYYLEYIDYAEEQDKEWVRVFENNPASSNQNSGESTQLMIRPSFPQWYYGHEVPEQFPNSDVTAIVDDAWKVGDLVDWFTQGCYWSGTITKLLGDDMIEVKLPAPPIGEGKRYHANCNDLRPTLEWSLTKGWMVPLSKAKKKSWQAARLIQDSKSESDKSTSHEESSSDDEYGDNSGGVLSGHIASTTPQEDPVVVALPSATNSASRPKAQTGAILPSTENLAPRSPSNSPEPSRGTQSAATSSLPAVSGVPVKQEPGIKTSIKQEQEWFLTEAEADGPDEFMVKVDKLDVKFNHHLQRKQVEQELCAEVLSSLPWVVKG